MQTRVRFEHTGYTSQGRFLFGLLAAFWLMVSLAFAGVFLPVAALLVPVVGVRLAWLRRCLGHSRSLTRSRVVDGRYVVLDRQRHYHRPGDT